MPRNTLLFARILQLDDDWNGSAYPSVTRWITAIRRRGDRPSTKLSYLKWLAGLLRFVNLTADEDAALGDRHTPDAQRARLIAKVADGVTPEGLVALGRGVVAEKVQAFCDTYNIRGKARTAHLALGALRSFLKYNGLDKLELEDYNWRKHRRPEYVPTKAEVCRMADHSDARGRAIILCAFQSGLRNATLRALCYGDVKEQLQAQRVPVVVHVTLRLRERVPQACKEDAEYYTFFGPEAAAALQDYLAWRTEGEGPIGEDEPLLLPYARFDRALGAKTHLAEDSLQRMVKRAARRARIKEWRHVRFHGLRKTFRAVLDAGYADGGQMAEDDKEYLMGHRLPAAKAPYHNANVDVLTERYMKLNWAPAQAASDALRKKQIIDMVKLLGYPDDKIKRVEEALAKYRDVDEALEEIKKLRLDAHTKADEPRRRDYAANNARARSEVRIVRGERTLTRLLGEDWDLVKELSQDRFLLRKSFD